jgi:hypothetical protein
MPVYRTPSDSIVKLQVLEDPLKSGNLSVYRDVVRVPGVILSQGNIGAILLTISSWDLAI